MKELSSSSLVSISGLSDVAAQCGLSDVLGATTYAGDIIVANQITGENISDEETPEILLVNEPDSLE